MLEEQDINSVDAESQQTATCEETEALHYRRNSPLIFGFNDGWVVERN
jgi:hypothetical protein